MGTRIRPELSEKNKYHISKHRYYELKHFCLQYPMWKRYYDSFIFRPSAVVVTLSSKHSRALDTVTQNLEERLYYLKKMRMVEEAAKETDEKLSCYILKGVTEGLSYDVLRVNADIPCCREVYYDLYRRFFWILSTKKEQMFANYTNPLMKGW